MALTPKQPSRPEAQAGGMESEPSKSRGIAVRMASSAPANKMKERREFSAALVEESRARGAYIIGKRLTKQAS